MGADGGTIAKRHDILSLHSNFKTNSNDNKIDRSETSNFDTCQLSSLQLYGNEPIVSDYKGQLYIKEKLLKYLLDLKLGKIRRNAKLEHISSMKDLCEVKIKWVVIDDKAYIECPVTKEVLRNSAFVQIRSCHCLMSYKLLKLKENHVLKCPDCNLPFELVDMVILDPLDREESRMINLKNHEILKDMGMTHSKQFKKKKKSNDFIDRFVKKRKNDLDDDEVQKKSKS